MYRWFGSGLLYVYEAMQSDHIIQTFYLKYLHILSSIYSTTLCARIKEICWFLLDVVIACSGSRKDTSHLDELYMLYD